MGLEATARWPQQEFEALLADGVIGYQRCHDCSAAIFYPRVLCPRCGGTSLGWERSRGLGTVYAATTVHARDEGPYNVALIDLDEGIRVMSRVEGLTADDVAIGMRVGLHVVTVDGEPAAIARPEGDDHGV